MRDVLEAITGEFSTETEADSWAVQREDGSWLFDGLIPTPELKDRLDLKELPEEDRGRYNTLAGMIMLLLGRLPEDGRLRSSGKAGASRSSTSTASASTRSSRAPSRPPTAGARGGGNLMRPKAARDGVALRAHAREPGDARRRSAIARWSPRCSSSRPRSPRPRRPRA